jgi:hypothetical protein
VYEDDFLEARYEESVSDLVLADSWDADEIDVPELYDTDDYDGYDEDFFG